MHWVILVAVLTITEQTALGPLAGAGVILASVAAAWVLARLVERPARTRAERGTRSATVVVVASALVVAVPLAGWQVADAVRRAMSDAAHPGAAVLFPGAVGSVVASDAEPIPAGADLDSEWAGLAEPCADELAPPPGTLDDSCRMQRGSGPDAPLVAIVGDSHAGQLTGIVRPIVESQGWNAVSLVRGGCPFAPDEPEVPGALDCTAWRAAALARLVRLQPDIVFMMGSRSTAETPDEAALAGLDAYLDVLVDAGSQIVLVRDNPRFGIDMFECVERHGAGSPLCERDLTQVLAAQDPTLSSRRSGVTPVDLTEWICPDGMCPAVIGVVVVYLDDNHLTWSYARTLAPALVQRSRAVLERFGYVDTAQDSWAAPS